MDTINSSSESHDKEKKTMDDFYKLLKKPKTKRDIAIQNDKILQELAIYQYTKGLSKTITKPEELEKITALFSEFKANLMKGEYDSIQQLEDQVYGRYGYVPLNVPIS